MARWAIPDEVPDKVIERFAPEEGLDEALARYEQEKAKMAISMQTHDTPEAVMDRIAGLKGKIVDPPKPTVPPPKIVVPTGNVRMKGKRKAMLTLRIEPDLLEWFRALGSGYQTVMAEALEAYRRGNE